MRFGVVATGAGALDRRLAELDALRFDALYVVDHPSFEQPDAWSWLAWAAGRTKRLRLGTHVTGMPFHHPFRLAKQVATVDRLSGGRAVLGIGTGYEHADFAPYGFAMPDFRGRVRQLGEGIRVLRALWTEEAAEFAGEHYRLEGGASFLPKPVQRPHPPIVVGLNRDGVLLRLAAREADGLNTWQLGPAQVAALAERAREALADAGRDPDAFAITADVILARGRTRAAADELAGGIAIMARGWGRAETATRWDYRGVLHGDADHMREQVAAFAAAGVSELAVSSSDFDDLAWFSEEVAAPASGGA